MEDEVYKLAAKINPDAFLPDNLVVDFNKAIDVFWLQKREDAKRLAKNLYDQGVRAKGCACND